MNKGLFSGPRLYQALRDYSIDNLTYKQGIIRQWKHSLSKENFDDINEQSLKGRFLVDIFEEVLGYKTRIGQDEWTMQVETRTELDATTPDATLGYFNDAKGFTFAVVEAKGASTGLDEKQKRKDDRSTVEQAFAYRHKHTYCEWVIITNFREIRLYSMDSSVNYELFKIEEMAGDLLLLERFCFLLGEKTLIRHHPQMDGSVVKKVYSDSVDFRKRIALGEFNRKSHILDAASTQYKETLSKTVQQKINKVDHALGEFIEVECGLPLAGIKGTDYPETFEFSRIRRGKIDPLKPISGVQYMRSDALNDSFPFDDKFFRGKRILVNRSKFFKPSYKSQIQATLTEESFFNGKELLNLVVTDDRLSPEYLVGLLNSELVSVWYTEQVQQRTAADYAQVVPTDIRRIPIALPSPENQELVEKSVKMRLVLEKQLLEEQEGFLTKMSYFPGTETLIGKIREKEYLGTLAIFQYLNEALQGMSSKKARRFKDLEEARNQAANRKKSQIRIYKKGCDGAVAKIYGLQLEEFLYVRDPSADRLDAVKNTQ